MKLSKHFRRTVVGPTLVLPAFLLVSLFLLAPLGVILRYSLDRYDPIKLMVGVISLENYVQAISDPFYQKVLLNTAGIAAVSTVIVMIFSFPVAYYISRQQSQRIRSWLIILVVLPLLLGNAVRSAAWMLMMGTKGVVNVSLITLGIITEPIKILYTPAAVVVALVSVLLPFAIITLQSVLDTIPHNLVEAGQSLGYSPLRCVTQVVIPLAMPGLIAASAICFSLAMNAYATPVLIGGPTMHMMGPSVYAQISKANNWPVGSTLACILVMVTMVLTIFSARMLARKQF